MAKDSVMKSIIRESVKEELKPVEKRLNNRFDDFEEKIINGVKALLSEFKSDLAQMKLEILGELEKTRQENAISSGKVREINKISDKVEKLEKNHPEFFRASI